jgi:hypothetical protein
MIASEDKAIRKFFLLMFTVNVGYLADWQDTELYKQV